MRWDMKWMFCFGCGLVFGCGIAAGQTNCPPSARELFSLPPVRLRALPAETEKAAPMAPTGRVADPAIQAATARAVVSAIQWSTTSSHSVELMTMSAEANDF